MVAMAHAVRPGIAPSLLLSMPQLVDPNFHRTVVLLCEHLGGRHQRPLVAALDRDEHRRDGDERLAGADVALEQPVHRHR